MCICLRLYILTKWLQTLSNSCPALLDGGLWSMRSTRSFETHLFPPQSLQEFAEGILRLLPWEQNRLAVLNQFLIEDKGRRGSAGSAGWNSKLRVIAVTITDWLPFHSFSKYEQKLQVEVGLRQCIKDLRDVGE